MHGASGSLLTPSPGSGRPTAGNQRCPLEEVALTSPHLLTRLATMSWIMPRLLPSVDMDLLSASMASWFVLPNRDSPFTAISWSFTRSRPSWEENVVKSGGGLRSLWWEHKKVSKAAVARVLLESFPRCQIKPLSSSMTQKGIPVQSAHRAPLRPCFQRLT